ncbi:hypothetical protein [Massilia antarctica]|uniref:hypothetical protein n=1 Tax=Massilia antarctica TaxID=2765360 RepID=UPI0011AF9328|nr:hypothetical protein [Massilia sp. H27-R4]MCY0916286.1 hypothetical protein [Massilia sp. H27-R4]
MKRFTWLAAAMSSALPALACSPLYYGAETESFAGVQRRFDSVESVVVATLTQARKVTKTLHSQFGEDVDVPAEEDTFVIEQVFKGPAIVGDTLVLTTALSGCGISAIAQLTGPFIPPRPGAKRAEKQPEAPRRWLIYRNQNDDTQLTGSYMARPLFIASSDLYHMPRVLAAASRR